MERLKLILLWWRLYYSMINALYNSSMYPLKMIYHTYRRCTRSTFNPFYLYSLRSSDHCLPLFYLVFITVLFKWYLLHRKCSACSYPEIINILRSRTHAAILTDHKCSNLRRSQFKSGSSWSQSREVLGFEKLLDRTFYSTPTLSKITIPSTLS